MHLLALIKHSGALQLLCKGCLPSKALDGASHSHTWPTGHMPEPASPQVGHAEVAHNAPL